MVSNIQPAKFNKAVSALPKMKGMFNTNMFAKQSGLNFATANKILNHFEQQKKIKNMNGLYYK